MKFLVAFIVLVTIQNLYGQELIWESQIDSIPTLSSPRPVDLTGDGVLDIVIGGGTDGMYSSAGVIAFNGVSGGLLWQSPSRNELFGSPIFQDISGDGIDLKSLINDPRDISMLCESASIPGRQFSTDEVTMHKQTVKMPYGFIDEDISMTFLLTNDMYMKKMFDNWTQSIINDDTYTLGYKKDYTTDVIIQQLNADNKVVYGAKLENAFPITIAPIEYSNDADGISKLTVTFAYDKYKLEGAVESGLSGITSALEIIT